MLENYIAERERVHITKQESLNRKNNKHLHIGGTQHCVYSIITNNWGSRRVVSVFGSSLPIIEGTCSGMCAFALSGTYIIPQLNLWGHQLVPATRR